jgi:hypothetical protein
MEYLKITGYVIVMALGLFVLMKGLGLSTKVEKTKAIQEKEIAQGTRSLMKTTHEAEELGSVFVGLFGMAIFFCAFIPFLEAILDLISKKS